MCALCKDLHFLFPGSIEESVDVGVWCLHVLKDLSDFVLVLDALRYHTLLLITWQT